MNNFWKEIMNCLLGVILYHGALPEEKSWYEQYKWEIENMITDIKNFHNALTAAGFEVSNEQMGKFLVYTEHVHISNDRMVQKCPVDELQLCLLASKINDELNN